MTVMDFRLTRGTARAYRYALPNGATGEGREWAWFSAPCWCGRTAIFQRVVGALSSTKCDARCTSATGHVCVCACGGANHGAAFE
jgi:hypothetical protein